MTALDAIEVAEDLGVHLSADAGRVKVTGPRDAVLRVLALLQSHREEIADLLTCSDRTARRVMQRAMRADQADRRTKCSPKRPSTRPCRSAK